MRIHCEEVVVSNQQGKILLGPASLTITKGLTALVGPNGAGKSTLLKAIANVYTLTHGLVNVEEDNRFLSVFERRMEIGYVPQEIALYEDMTLRRYLTYLAELKCISRERVVPEVERVCTQFSLQAQKETRITKLSDGQKRKAMIAQAFLGNPKILLLDEPFANLDIEEREHLLHLLVDYSQKSIIILATHLADELNYPFDRVVGLREGMVEEGNLRL